MSFRGGARIGWVAATWPFAGLRVNRDRLTLSSMGTYEFTPDQVVAIEPYRSIPLIGNGLRIVHNRSDFPERLIFWYLGGIGYVLSGIHHSGFHPSGKPKPRVAGFPVKWSVIVLAVAAWNGLFLLDRGWEHAPARQLGPFAAAAVILLFIVSAATLAFPFMQRAVLRDGHDVGEVKSFLILLVLVLGLLSVGISGTLLAGVYAG